MKQRMIELIKADNSYPNTMRLLNIEIPPKRFSDALLQSLLTSVTSGFQKIRFPMQFFPLFSPQRHRNLKIQDFRCIPRLLHHFLYIGNRKKQISDVSLPF
jgi:hypothetical protein